MERALPIVPASDVGVIPAKRRQARHRCDWSTVVSLQHVERRRAGVATIDVGYVRCRECGEYWKIVNAEDETCGTQWLRRGEKAGAHEFSGSEFYRLVVGA